MGQHPVPDAPFWQRLFGRALTTRERQLAIATADQLAEFTLARQAVDRLIADRRTLCNAVDVALLALADQPTTCRYHGGHFHVLGTEPYEPGLPRCDSCKQPYRVHRALVVITSALRLTAHNAEAGHG